MAEANEIYAAAAAMRDEWQGTAQDFFYTTLATLLENIVEDPDMDRRGPVYINALELSRSYMKDNL